MIAVNWKDHKAINVSKTPRPPDNWCNTQESQPLETGDLRRRRRFVDRFWQGNHDKWEDESGTLHDYPFTYTHSGSTRTPGRRTEGSPDEPRIACNAPGFWCTARRVS